MYIEERKTIYGRKKHRDDQLFCKINDYHKNII